MRRRARSWSSRSRPWLCRAIHVHPRCAISTLTTGKTRFARWYREIRYLLPVIPAHSRILLLHEPPDVEWTLQFLIPLGQKDRSIGVFTVPQLKKSGPVIRFEEFTYFLDYSNGHFRLVSRDEARETVRRPA